jgi:thiol-disulfide isomerase/thioredoxin
LSATRRRLLAAMAVAAIAGPLSASELRRWTGEPRAPAIDLLRTDGTPLSLAEFRGKVVLVNFWATWCEPCVTEMPALQRLRDALGPQGLEVLAVNFQEGPARIDAFVQKLGLSLPVVRDTDGSVAKAWNARIFPASYVVDRSGSIRYGLIGGADWTSPELLSTVRELLGPQPSR